MHDYQGLIPGTIWRTTADLSSRCNLECPGCGRTWAKKNKLLTIEDWSIEDFEKFLLLNKEELKKLILCQSLADAPNDKHFYERFISRDKIHPLLEFQIESNGCSASTKTWEKVAHKLKKDDRIIWHVDGADHETNIIYRVNSKFSLIKKNIKIVNKILHDRGLYDKVTTDFRMIVFSHNYHQIYDAFDLSKELDCNTFSIIESDGRTPKEMRLSDEQSRSIGLIKSQLSTM